MEMPCKKLECPHEKRMNLTATRAGMETDFTLMSCIMLMRWKEIDDESKIYRPIRSEREGRWRA